MINRIIITVLDSFGIGELPDCADYEDQGSDTLGHIYKETKMQLPNLKKLGLYNIDGVNVPEKEQNVIGAYGKAIEQSAGKNSPVGHWEIAGYIKKEPFATYPNGFPENMLEEFKQKTGVDRNFVQ